MSERQRPLSINITLDASTFQRIIDLAAGASRSATKQALHLIREGLQLGKPVVRRVTSDIASGATTQEVLGVSLASDEETRALTIYVTPDILRAIDIFRERHDMRTRARAARVLLCAGMNKGRVTR
jgi:hypothetical protein